MERYFEEVRAGERSGGRVAEPRAGPSAAAVKLIAEYEARRERLLVPAFTDVTSMLAKAADAARERMRHPTSWALKRANDVPQTQTPSDARPRYRPGM
jgi:hypothetical protein